MYSLSIETIQSLLVDNNLLRDVVIQKSWHYRLTDDQQLEKVVEDISYFSGESKLETLFFCKGKNFKEAYLHEALSNGTTFFVAEKAYETDSGIGFIVSDIRKAMAILARAYFDYPDQKLHMIGITGTKGKTTTTYLTQNILQNAFPDKVAYTSSIDNYYDAKNHYGANLTTPESLDLFKMFAVAVENNMEYFVMEVSSQAYKLDRVYGIQFDYGVFLNISPDHISEFEHPSLEDYLYCKRQLLVNSTHAVIYSGTDHIELLLEEAKEVCETITTYGSEEESLFQLDFEENDSHNFKLTNTETNETEDYPIGLAGDFNKLNAVASIIISKGYKVSKNNIDKALDKTVVPGRMEKMTLPNGVTVIIDFAHNYLSIKTLLEFVSKEYPESKVVTVSGGPGSRGEDRLLGMAKVFSNYGDIIYLTSDNPDYDEPSDLSHLISDHIEGAHSIIIENNREKAITKAVSSAKPDDVVVIMGKGTENYQIINGKNVPYIGDRKAVQNYIDSLSDK